MLVHWILLIFVGFHVVVVPAALLTAPQFFELYNASSHRNHLPYCSVSNIFHGTWTYREHNSGAPLLPTMKEIISVSYATCPETLLTINSTDNAPFLGKPLQYSCDPSQIKPAQFIPHHCHIMHELVAAGLLARKLGSYHSEVGHKPLQVVVMGDSIGGELFVALDCMLHEKKLTSLVNTTFVWETYFRNDLPCDGRCTALDEQGSKFRKQQRDLEYGSQCERCPDGVRHYITEFEYNSKWKQLIPADADCLVLNSGSWYSSFRGMNSTVRYEETIRMVIVPTLVKLMQANPNLQVYWVDLPPYVGNLTHGTVAGLLMRRFNNRFTKLESSTDSGDPNERIDLCRDICRHCNDDAFLANNTEADKWFLRRGCDRCLLTEAYDWHIMHEKDQIAETYMSAIGVHFMNSRPALYPRKIADPLISVEGLHWWYVLLTAHVLVLDNLTNRFSYFLQQSWAQYCAHISSQGIAAPACFEYWKSLNDKLRMHWCRVYK
jgi:hypothetical protein